MKSKFASCLNCIDGRVQLPVIRWIIENYDVDYVDMITEPGMDGKLADENFDIEPILNKLNTSINVHNSKDVFVVGHYDCAGNFVDEETHRKQIANGVSRISEFIPSIKVTGLWVSEEFVVEKVNRNNR